MPLASSLLQLWKKSFRQIEEILTLLTLFLIFLFPLLDILDRETSFFKFSSSAIYLKFLMVWFALLAAQLASKRREHLSLAVFEHLLPERLKPYTKIFTVYIISVVIFCISFAGFGYIKLISQGQPAVGPFPLWLLLLVIPLGYLVIGLRASNDPTFSMKKSFLITTAALVTPILVELLPEAVATHLFIPSILLLTVATLLGAPIFTVLSGFAGIFIFHEELSILGTNEIGNLFLWLINGTTENPIVSQGLSSIPHMAYQVLTEDAFPTIPLFTFVGFMLSESKAGERLVNFFKALLGGVPGGIAIVAVGVSAFFTTFTGASGVTILALGGLLYYVMKKDGYGDTFTVGYLTASGSIGLLFPPSLPIILYAAKAEIDPRHLFAGGFIPGVILVASIAIYALYKRDKSIPKAPHASLKEMLIATRNALGELFLPIIIIVGYFGGFTTIVQSASIAVLYLLITHLFIHKDITIRGLSQVALKSAPIAGSILIIIAAANSLQDFIVMAEIPTQLTTWFTSHVDPSDPQSKFIFLFVLNIALLVAGCFMDIFSAIIVIVPLITPISQAFGIDPIHLGIIFLANLELGYLTPPVGLNLFLSALRFDKPLLVVYKSVLPFLLIMIAMVGLITYVPAITNSGVTVYKTVFPTQQQQRIEDMGSVSEEETLPATETQDSTVESSPELPANFMDQIND